MKFEKYIKIDDLSRQFALTNEQLLEYLFLNDIEIFKSYKNRRAIWKI